MNSSACKDTSCDQVTWGLGNYSGWGGISPLLGGYSVVYSLCRLHERTPVLFWISGGGGSEITAGLSSVIVQQRKLHILFSYWLGCVATLLHPISTHDLSPLPTLALHYRPMHFCIDVIAFATGIWVKACQ